MSQEAITIEDCLINLEVNDLVTIINDGRVIQFVHDESIRYNEVYQIDL